MAITSRGYSGTIDYADWAELASAMGGQYGVLEPGAFQASPGAGSLQVKLAVGTAVGHGILDVSDAAVTLTAAAVSGSSRWDLVALRRDWSAGTTTPVLIQGDAKAIPTRNTNPGTVDDQPLWLVRWASGQSAPQEFVDLRVWHGDGGMLAGDLMVRDYLNRPGTVLWINGQLWVRQVNSSGIASWVSALNLSGMLTASRLIITAPGDVGLAGGSPGILIGAENDYNVGIDNNEIMARYNGQPTSLGLNWEGGNVNIGNADSSVGIPGKLSTPALTAVMNDVKSLKSTVAKLDDVQSATSGVSAASGWTVSSIVLTKSGGSGFVRATFTRTGGDIKSGPSGDIGNTLLGTVTTSAYRSRNAVPLAPVASGPAVSAYMNVDGKIYLAAIPPNWTLSKGWSFQLGGMYFLS